MKRELETQLVRDFPFCFGDYRKDPTQSCMAFGCECGDGWYDLIREACAKAEYIIEQYIEAHKYDEDFNEDFTPRLAQVKEKFGTLRLYFTAYPDGIDEIEREAEKKSETTCETCGKSGKMRGMGWLYVSCIEHAKEEDLDSLEIVEDAYVKKEKRNDK